MITYVRSTLNEQRKVYWAGRSSSNDLGRSDGFWRQVGNGIHPGDESGDYSSVLCGTARNAVGDLRGRDLRRLVVRSAQRACGQTRGLQSAQERSAEMREQERSDRCAKACGVVTRQSSQTGLPW